MLGPTDPPEYSWLYGVPAVVFTGGFLAAASTGMAGLVQAGYLTSSLLCIGKSHSAHFLNGTNFLQVLCLDWLRKLRLAKEMLLVYSV